MQIDRHKDLEPEELLHEYVQPERPVILTEAAKRWKAIGKWTPEFFQQHYGRITYEISGRSYTLAEQVDLMRRSSTETPAPYPYNLEVADYFPELMNDLAPQLVFGKSDRAMHPLMPRALIHGTPVHEVFFGSKGSSFPFVHYDALELHTRITQIYGEKEFVLFQPSDGRYLYPRADNPKFSQVTDVYDPDLARFPEFHSAQPIHCTLAAGETIFFPRGWWHTTRMSGPSITYGRIVLNSTNYQAYLDDKYERWKKAGLLKAALAYGAGKVVGGAMRVAEAFT